MKVAIIGGGPSGLTAAKACLEEHLVPTIFERDLHLGGLWKLGSGGRVWSSLKTNLSKHTCCFSDFPWPLEAPTFPTSAQVREYVESYAARFDLTRHVRFGHSIASVRSTTSGGWEITFTTTATSTTSRPATGEGGTKEDVQHPQKETFDRCIVASGIFSAPSFPLPTVVKGVTDAVRTGWATHGGAYREPAFYAGKAVLVVGCAFSGAEIASDLAGTATRCIVAAGRASVFLPRYIARGGQQPTSSDGTKAVVQDGGLDGGVGNSTIEGAEAIKGVVVRVINSADATGQDTGGSLGTLTVSRREDAVSCDGNISKQADQGVDDSDAIRAVKGARAKMVESLVPLDLALYPRKSKAESAANVVPTSASEKIATYRKFLLGLARQDPGDAHDVLNLDSCYERPLHVVVSDDFLGKVRAGAIEVRSRLIALDVRERTAHFSDGTGEKVDQVLFCTGFRPSLDFLPPSVLQQLEYDPNDSLQPLILQHQTWSPDLADLAFVGVYRGPYFGVMELQARWVARLWAGMVEPSTTAQSEAACRRSREIRAARPRPQFPTDYADIMEALAEAAGLLPPPLDSTYVAPILTRLCASFSDDLQDQVNRGGTTVCSIDLWKDEIQNNIQSWVWNGPLLPCHYRLGDLFGKREDSHAATEPARLRLGNVGCRGCSGGGGSSNPGDAQEVLLRVLAEIRDVNTKLQSGVGFST